MELVVNFKIFVIKALKHITYVHSTLHHGR